MSEFNLRIPVAKWLITRGLSPICEVQCLRNCDLVGVAFDERKKLCRMVAVELKLTDVAGVIRQCLSHAEIATETWAAMPPISEKNRKRFADARIGLLQVVGADVLVMHDASENPRTIEDLRRWHSPLRRRRDEYKWRMLHPQMLRFPAQRMVWEANNIDRIIPATVQGTTR